MTFLGGCSEAKAPTPSLEVSSPVCGEQLSIPQKRKRSIRILELNFLIIVIHKFKLLIYTNELVGDLHQTVLLSISFSGSIRL